MRFTASGECPESMVVWKSTKVCAQAVLLKFACVLMSAKHADFGSVEHGRPEIPYFQ
jgi:hypothetical protein